MKNILLLLIVLNLAFGEYVERVIDGDTIIVRDSKNHKSKIRLYGIDAPEKKQKGGRKATKYLQNQIYHKNVAVKGNKKDRYKRKLAKIYLNGKDINAQMVQSGNAHAYRKYSKDYVKNENIAKKAKRGIWKDGNAVEPEKFRKARKIRKTKR